MASFGVGLNSEDLSELNNVTNLDDLLNALGLSLTTDNIRKQINNETSSTINFLEEVRGKFDNFLVEETIDEEDKTEIKLQMMDFCEDLIQQIVDEYGLFLNVISDDYETLLSILDILYNFFILNRYQNVEDFIIQYIEINKVPLSESIENDDKIKDVTTISNRKKNFDPLDVFILSHINEIINFIKNSGVIDSHEFINTINDGELYISKIANLFDDGTLYGNFVPRLLQVVLGEEYDSNEATRIRNSIRTSFYTKAPIILTEGEV